MVSVDSVTTSATAALILTASEFLRQPVEWPGPATGLAARICAKTGTVPPAIMSEPVRSTSSTQLRRTPELAAFGYVFNRLDSSQAALWLDAIEHLRGREIFPPDRQSFVFNPIELLGIASGIEALPLDDDKRVWFVDTLRRGFIQGHFKGGASALGAFTGLRLLDEHAASQHSIQSIDLSQSSELLLVAAIAFAFAGQCPISIDEIEAQLHDRLLVQPVSLTDVSEAVAAIVLAHRIRDRALTPTSPLSDIDRVVGLCRRFPLFVDTLRTRQRSRQAFGVDDEYDVQDLLHAILRLHFDDVRPEEHTPSYGGNHSRVDFMLPRERIVVEAKMTRKGLGQKEVVDQLTIDTARYTKMGDVDTLVCIVYDPQRICVNPKAIETDVETSGSRLSVRVIVCPQGL